METTTLAVPDPIELWEEAQASVQPGIPADLIQWSQKQSQQYFRRKVKNPAEPNFWRLGLCDKRFGTTEYSDTGGGMEVVLYVMTIRTLPGDLPETTAHYVGPPWCDELFGPTSPTFADLQEQLLLADATYGI